MSQNPIDSCQTITITQEDIFHQVKLSCKIPETIEKIIERKIIISAAEAAEIKVTKEELQQASDQMRAMSQLKDAQATWAWLEKYGLSLDDFEEIVHISLISKKLINYLCAEKVEAYFYEHQLDYTCAIIYEIILDDQDEALELFYEIQESEISFYDAAQQYIQDLELRRKGGYRGKVNRAEMKPEVSATVFAAMPSQLLKPIVTADGIYLVLVEEIIQTELDRDLRQQIMLSLYSQWLEQQTTQVQIVNQIEFSDYRQL
jgi:parvulin-like peptidyl-prolyl isomerase